MVFSRLGLAVAVSALTLSLAPTPLEAATQPLSGVVIAIDPGHQLGNHNFPSKINRLVNAGGFKKACNSTGTATNSGFPEATFTFLTARRVARRLRDLGAVVYLTRTANSQSLWGPCIDARGLFGAKVGADLTLSIHGDGSTSGGRGFHIIAPTLVKGYTGDILKPSARLARVVRSALVNAGYTPATYTAGGDGLDFRGDLGTLNRSDVPVVMAELGNMRSARDAAWMSTPEGRDRMAASLVRGLRAFLRR